MSVAQSVLDLKMHVGKEHDSTLLQLHKHQFRVFTIMKPLQLQWLPLSTLHVSWDPLEPKPPTSLEQLGSWVSSVPVDYILMFLRSVIDPSFVQCYNDNFLYAF